MSTLYNLAHPPPLAQIGLEDYCVMQGQAHNIDDYGAPNWGVVSAGDDLIVRFWKWIEVYIISIYYTIHHDILSPPMTDTPSPPHTSPHPHTPVQPPTAPSLPPASASGSG